MNQETAMMKNKGSVLGELRLKPIMMIGLCSEPFFDSFRSILIFEVSAI